MAAPKFSLNLDGTLKKRSPMQDRGEDQPGQYSPRPTAVAPPSSSPTPSSPPSSPSTTPTASAGASGSSTRPGTPSSLPTALKKHVDPTSSVAEAVAAEEAAIGITDPDMDVILAAKPRLSASAAGAGGGYGGRASSTGSASVSSDSPPRHGSDSATAAAPVAATTTTTTTGSRRTPAALATLVGHQNARQPAAAGDASKAVSTGDATASTASASGRAGSPGASVGRGTAALASAASRRGSATAASAPSSSHATDRSRSNGAASTAAGEGKEEGGHVSSVHLEEGYILGRTFKQFVASTSRLSISGITGSKGGGTFRQNPSQYVSAMTSYGDYVAIGDRTGHVAVMKRKPMTDGQHQALLDEEARQDADWLSSEGRREGDRDDPHARGAARALSSSYPAPRTQDLYDFHVGQQAYTSVIDPLNSVEVTPNVSALAFLPQASPAAYLLTANEKVPKLYKVMTVRESAMPFRAVDKIDSKTIGPLTAASRASTVTMKPVARYALSHEYNIHSICPLADSEQFVTGDDLTMHLWCTEYPDTSIETFDIRPPYDEEPREAIRCVRVFPHEPFLLFAATSSGSVRVIDVRQTLRWGGQTPQLFVNPPREADGNFSHVTNSLSDCALSPCGRYIVGRDFMTTCLWDVRVAGGSGASGGGAFPSSPSHRATPAAAGSDYNVVQRWELHPNLRSNLETLYQSDLLFERFDVQFVNHRQVCTGGFGNALYTMDVTQTPSTGGDGVEVFHLPTNEGVADITRTTVHAKPAPATNSSTGGDPGKNGTAAAGANTLELGSRITLLSRPTMSLGGMCGMMLCCGQVVMQLSYTS